MSPDPLIPHRTVALLISCPSLNPISIPTTPSTTLVKISDRLYIGLDLRMCKDWIGAKPLESFTQHKISDGQTLGDFASPNDTARNETDGGMTGSAAGDSCSGNALADGVPIAPEDELIPLSET